MYLQVQGSQSDDWDGLQTIIVVKPFKYKAREQMFELAPLHLLPVGAVFAAAGLGFSLSLLFFMDQNISSALVNAPSNK